MGFSNFPIKSCLWVGCRWANDIIVQKTLTFIRNIGIYIIPSLFDEFTTFDLAGLGSIQQVQNYGLRKNIGENV